MSSRAVKEALYLEVTTTLSQHYSKLVRGKQVSETDTIACGRENSYPLGTGHILKVELHTYTVWIHFSNLEKTQKKLTITSALSQRLILR